MLHGSWLPHAAGETSLYTLITLLISILLAVSNSQQNHLEVEKSKMVPLAAGRIRDEPESVWQEFIQLALEYKPLNLGQGFPDFAAPKYLIESLHNATQIAGGPKTELNSQYTRSFGHPRLVRAICRYYNEFRDFNKLQEPNTQVLVTVGAYEALFVSVMAFVEPGDEVLIVDPAFDAYAPLVGLAQGKQVYIPLRKLIENSTSGEPISSASYGFDMTEFESKISNKTKMLILNSPNNPLGKVFSLEELEAIARLCRKHNLIVLADEVYEHMYYPNWKHLSIASLPGMWERTITVGSAGKAFSVTGWKIGWALGPQHLIKYLQLVHQTAVYTVATPLQEAIARALEREMELLSATQTAPSTSRELSSTGQPEVELGQAKGSYWPELRIELAKKRDRMANILRDAQLEPIVPQGGYFMLVDFSKLAQRYPQYFELGSISGTGKQLSRLRSANSTRATDSQDKPNANKRGANDTNDFRFARWLSIEMGLQGIPASAFYSDKNKPLARNLIRFCFIKRDSTLDQLEELIKTKLTNSNSSSSLAPIKRSNL